MTNQHTLVLYAFPLVLWMLYIGRHEVCAMPIFSLAFSSFFTSPLNHFVLNISPAAKLQRIEHLGAAGAAGTFSLPLPLLGCYSWLVSFSTRKRLIAARSSSWLVGRHLHPQRMAGSWFLDALSAQGVWDLRLVLGEGISKWT